MSTQPAGASSTTPVTHEPAVGLLREVAATGLPGEESLRLATELTARPVHDLLAELIADQLARQVEPRAPE
jgi:hypothetical protein